MIKINLATISNQELIVILEKNILKMTKLSAENNVFMFEIDNNNISFLGL